MAIPQHNPPIDRTRKPRSQQTRQEDRSRIGCANENKALKDR